MPILSAVLRVFLVGISVVVLLSATLFLLLLRAAHARQRKHRRNPPRFAPESDLPACYAPYRAAAPCCPGDPDNTACRNCTLYAGPHHEKEESTC